MTVQRITGGGFFAFCYDDVAAGDEIRAGGVSVFEPGGEPGFPAGEPGSPEAPGGGPITPYYDLITGGGMFGVSNRDSVKYITILTGGVVLNGKGKTETHSSGETAAYPRIIFY